MVSGEYAPATLAGSLLFQAASAALVFWRAVSAVNGGRGCCGRRCEGGEARGRGTTAKKHPILHYK